LSLGGESEYEMEPEQVGNFISSSLQQQQQQQPTFMQLSKSAPSMANTATERNAFSHTAHNPKYALYDSLPPQAQASRWNNGQANTAYPPMPPPSDLQQQFNYTPSENKGLYSSQSFVPSYPSFPDWISSSVISGATLKRKYPNYPQVPAAYTNPAACFESPVQPERRPPMKHVVGGNAAVSDRAREVFLCSENEKSFVGFVHISLKSTLAELRCKIQNEGVRIGECDFIFLYKGAPVGREQERRLQVKDCASERLGKTTVTTRDVVASLPSNADEGNRTNIAEGGGGDKMREAVGDEVRPTTKLRKTVSMNNIRRSAVEQILNSVGES